MTIYAGTRPMPINLVTSNLLLYVNGGSPFSYRPGTNQPIWEDLSGNNNHMTIDANASFSSTYDGGLRRGASGNVAVAPTINLSTNYTISFWVKTGTTAQSGDAANIVTLGVNHKFRHNTGAGGGLRQVYGSNNYANIDDDTDANNTLYYVTGTYVSSTQAMAMYTGSALLVGSAIASGGSPGSVAVTLTGAYSGIEFYSLKLYNTVLTTAQITQNYNATKTRFGL